LPPACTTERLGLSNRFKCVHLIEEARSEAGRPASLIYRTRIQLDILLFNSTSGFAARISSASRSCGLAGGPGLIPRIIKLRVPPIPRVWGSGRKAGTPETYSFSGAAGSGQGISAIGTKFTIAVRIARASASIGRPFIAARTLSFCFTWSSRLRISSVAIRVHCTAIMLALISKISTISETGVKTRIWRAKNVSKHRFLRLIRTKTGLFRVILPILSRVCVRGYASAARSLLTSQRMHSTAPSVDRRFRRKQGVSTP